jgi:hypothetical protein
MSYNAQVFTWGSASKLVMTEAEKAKLLAKMLDGLQEQSDALMAERRLQLVAETKEDLVKRILREMDGKPNTVVAKRIAAELIQRETLLAISKRTID